MLNCIRGTHLAMMYLLSFSFSLSPAGLGIIWLIQSYRGVGLATNPTFSFRENSLYAIGKYYPSIIYVCVIKKYNIR
jgi:hypothetical protein